MFSSKFPASAALIMLIASAVKDSVKALGSDESLLQKLTEYSNLMPSVIGFIPQAGKIAAEVKSFEVADAVSAAEMLVAELSFSSDHAQKIVAAAFPILEDLAGMGPKVSALVAAIKG